MRYTRSRDGALRATLHLGATVRLTREEVACFMAMVRRLGHVDLRASCAFHRKQQRWAALPADDERALASELAPVNATPSREGAEDAPDL